MYMQFLLIYTQNQVLCSYNVIGGEGGNIDASTVAQIFAVILTATASEMSKGWVWGGGERSVADVALNTK